MIICKEIAEYLQYAEEHPKRISKEVKLLIENIVSPTLRRNNVFFDEKIINCSHIRNSSMLSHLCIKEISPFFLNFLL